MLTPYPFAQSGFETSPLGRVIEQGAAGTSWRIQGAAAEESSNHTQRSSVTTNDQVAFVPTNITTNAGSHKVALYTARINANGSRSLLRTGNTATYTNGQLEVSISRDENWIPTDKCFGTTETFKDKEGLVVLKRTYNIKGSAAQMLSTYYVYDERNQLSFVLPPGASPDTLGVAISQTVLDSKCYQYRYDGRGRMTMKKVPGKGWDLMVYNKLDQVVGTQDSVQRMKAPQEWTINKYDAFGRQVLTGIYQHPSSTAGPNNQAVVQGLVSGVGTYWETPVATGNGYTSNAWPLTVTTVLGATYYDTYSGIPNFPSAYVVSGNSTHTTGLVTASKVLVLNSAGDYLWTVNYYDEEGKSVRTFSQHYLGGSSALSQYNYDDISSAYNFNRQPTTVSRQHYMKNTGGTGTLVLTATDVYTYDHMGRKLKTTNTLKDGINTAQAPVVIAQATYNEIGQLVKKGLHSLNGTSFLQNVNYRYNARGWTSNINNATLTADGGLTNTDTNDQFGMDMNYDGPAMPQYNGNIGSVKTLTGPLNGSSYPALIYNYKYDKLNRLTNAVSTSSATVNDNFYNENFAYDVMGNILKLNRYDNVSNNRTAIDSLTFTYVNGNKVDRIDDAVAGGTIGFFEAVKQPGEYTYDGNGNQLTDQNKGITQQYNMLNLPQTVTKSGISVAYVYDASGQKLRKLSTNGSITTITEYIGGIQYEYTGTTPVLSFIQTEEGRARKSGTTYKYEYDLKDHLGDTRITMTWNASDPTQMTPVNLQRNDYYAFGYTIQSLIGSLPSPPNNYLYNHKELQVETGYYDYGARFYDPVTGRWGVMDKLAEDENQIDKSPYAYVWNNPITKDDPDGNCPMCVGALVGAGLDIAFQAIEIGLDKNKSYSKNFSWTSVALSAAAGAAGVGIATKVARAVELSAVGGKLLGNIIKRGVDAGVSAGASAIQQKVLKGEIDPTKVLIDGLAGAVGGHLGDKAEQAALKAAEGKVLKYQAGRAARMSVGGRQTRVLAAKVAKEKLTNFTAVRSAASAVGASGSAGNTVKLIKDQLTETKK